MSSELDERLPSGLTLRECLARAARWWDETGRYLVNPAFNETRGEDRARGPGQGSPALLIPGSAEQDLQSPILRGLPWDQLDVESKRRVATVWHYWYMEQEAPAEARNQVAEGTRQRLLHNERPDDGAAEPGDGGGLIH